jgi:hypothetical protein
MMIWAPLLKKSKHLNNKRELKKLFSLGPITGKIFRDKDAM